MNTLRVGLYARVSTADQQTLPMQMAAMREYAERRGWTIVAEFQETGCGAKVRAKHQELIKMARRRQIDVIVVWRLDRWGRSLQDLVNSLAELTAVGVAFVSVTEAIDLTTPGGKAITGMLAVFAEFERDILKERIRAGITAAKKRGTAFGRPATARAQTDKIRKLSAEGLNKAQIAKRLNIGRASVFRALAA